MTAKWLFATLCAGCLACSCSEKPERWDFDNLDGLVCTHQDDNPARQIECRNGVMKIFTVVSSGVPSARFLSITKLTQK